MNRLAFDPYKEIIWEWRLISIDREVIDCILDSHSTNSSESTKVSLGNMSAISITGITETYLTKLRRFLVIWMNLINIFFFTKTQQLSCKLQLALLCSQEEMRLLMQNIFIETHYLTVFMRQITTKMSQLGRDYHYVNEASIQKLLREVSQQYTRRFINQHSPTNESIIDVIAVNHQEYEEDGLLLRVFNAIVFILMCLALIGVFIARYYNQIDFQDTASYSVDLKLFRGASYPIYFGWVLGVTFSLCQRWGINYQLITIDNGNYLPKPSRFFLSASILTLIHLTGLMLYLLDRNNLVIVSFASSLGLIVWGLVVLFMVNPFQILNYPARRYFFVVFLRVAVVGLTRWCQMNPNMFILTITLISFIQPFNDFAFAVCRLTTNSACVTEANRAAYCFGIFVLISSLIELIRMHFAVSNQCCVITRPFQGAANSIMRLIAFIGFICYNQINTDTTWKVWIALSIISTLFRINANIRANWGLISLSNEDCLLKKRLSLKRRSYFIVFVIDIILNWGWTLTLSSSTAHTLKLLPVYLTTIVNYVQLARKGMWIAIRIDDHNTDYFGNYRAIRVDDHIIQGIKGDKADVYFEILKTNKRLVDQAVAKKEQLEEEFRKEFERQS